VYLSGPVSERYTRVKLFVVGVAEGVILGVGVGVTLIVTVI